MPSEPATRWQRRKEARPAEILAAALACFKERGFAATRLEDVAAQAGVTKGTLYLYYPSKEELFKAVVRGELVPNIEPLEAALDEPGPAAALLERLCTVWAQRIVPSPVSILPKLVITEASNFPALARFYLETAVHRALRLVAAILRRGIASGEFRPLDAQAVCRAHLDLLLQGLQRHSPPPAQMPAREGS